MRNLISSISNMGNLVRRARTELSIALNLTQNRFAYMLFRLKWLLQFSLTSNTEQSNRTKSFLAIITSSRDEVYLEEWVAYYLEQGVDYIHIIDDHIELAIPDSIKQLKNVIIHKKTPWINSSTIYHAIRLNYEWMMYIDCDEYIVTRRNFVKTIRNELEETFKDAHCVKIPWVMFSSNGRITNPKNLKKENVHRWNHDQKHPHPHNWKKGRCRFNKIEVKYIFRPSHFSKVGLAAALQDHHPKPNSNSIRCVVSLQGEPAKVDSFHENLRERDITNAYLTCNHYRIISKESCERKIRNSRYYGNATLNDMLASDHSEIVDTVLAEKCSFRP